MIDGTVFYLLMGLLLVGIFSLILAMIWRIMREFFHNNYSYFDFIFVIAYFIEQLTLIILLALAPEKIVFWVSAFALLVVTTASVQKLSMDSRDRKIREANLKLNYSSERKNEIINDLRKQINELSDYINELESVFFTLQHD